MFSGVSHVNIEKSQLILFCCNALQTCSLSEIAIFIVRRVIEHALYQQCKDFSVSSFCCGWLVGFNFISSIKLGSVLIPGSYKKSGQNMVLVPY